jgi:hypothetical protein
LGMEPAAALRAARARRGRFPGASARHTRRHVLPEQPAVSHRSRGNAVTGGYVYRGSLIARLQGTYFFGDFIDAHIWSFQVDPVTGKVILSTLKDRTAELGRSLGPGALASFGEDGFGELYLVDYAHGQIVAMVPELSTWASMSAGLVCVFWLAWRRRRSIQRFDGTRTVA